MFASLSSTEVTRGYFKREVHQLVILGVLRNKMNQNWDHHLLQFLTDQTKNRSITFST